jgi:HAD superfamily hydrolase (TIGR01509 family)
MAARQRSSARNAARPARGGAVFRQGEFAVLSWNRLDLADRLCDARRLRPSRGTRAGTHGEIGRLLLLTTPAPAPVSDPSCPRAAAVEAVVLDMDGTLLDTEGAYRAAFLQSAAALGHAVDEAFYATLVGVSSRDRGALVAARYGPGFPWAECLRDYRARKALLLANGVRAKPGAAELLAECAARGLPCAVATSATRRTALLALDRAGLLGAFAALVAREDVAEGKPHPALFLRAAEALDTPPSRCLAVEDSPPGVVAAQMAGMRVVMVPDALPPTPELRRSGLAVVADLQAVRALLLLGLRDREGGAA